MSDLRIQTWLAVFVVAIGGLVTAVLAMFLYMFVTGPLHEDPGNLPSVARVDPAKEWIDAVGRGRRIMHDALVDHNLPGLSVAVGVGGDIVWAEGFGWADLEKRVPVAPETRFVIGSASIPLTSAGVGLLLEKNKLALDSRFQAYAPEIPQQDWPVTLGQVMSHTAGVADDGGEQGPLFAKHCERPVEALQFLSGFERAALHARDRVPQDELRLDHGERGGRRRRRRAVHRLHADAGLRTAWHGRDDRRFIDGAGSRSRDVVLPAVHGGAALRGTTDRFAGPVVLRGGRRIPLHPVRPRALRSGHQQRKAAATRDGHITADATAATVGAGDGVWPWMASPERDVRRQTNALDWS